MFYKHGTEKWLKISALFSNLQGRGLEGKRRALTDGRAQNGLENTLKSKLYSHCIINWIVNDFWDELVKLSFATHTAALRATRSTTHTATQSAARITTHTLQHWVQHIVQHTLQHNTVDFWGELVHITSASETVVRDTHCNTECNTYCNTTVQHQVQHVLQHTLQHNTADLCGELVHIRWVGETVVCDTHYKQSATRITAHAATQHSWLVRCASTHWSKDDFWDTLCNTQCNTYYNTHCNTQCNTNSSLHCNTTQLTFEVT